MKKGIVGLTLSGFLLLSAPQVFATDQSKQINSYQYRSNYTTDMMKHGAILSIGGTVGFIATDRIPTYRVIGYRAQMALANVFTSLASASALSASGGTILFAAGSIIKYLNFIRNKANKKAMEEVSNYHAKRSLMIKSARISTDLLQDQSLIKQINALDCKKCVTQEDRVREFQNILNGAEEISYHLKDIMIEAQKAEHPEIYLQDALIENDQIKQIIENTMKGDESKSNLAVLSNLSLQATTTRLIRD